MTAKLHVILPSASYLKRQLLNKPEQKNDIPVQAYQNSLPTQVSFSEIRRFSILQKFKTYAFVTL